MGRVNTSKLLSLFTPAFTLTSTIMPYLLIKFGSILLYVAMFPFLVSMEVRHRYAFSTTTTSVLTLTHSCFVRRQVLNLASTRHPRGLFVSKRRVKPYKEALNSTS